MNCTITYMNPFKIPGLRARETAELAAMRPKRNGTSQATRRREIRRRSNLPKAIQKRLGFKCH